MRDGATSVEKVTRTVSPGGSRTRRRKLTIGSSTAPVVLERGWPSITAAGVRIPRPRPRNRARSVSHCNSPTGSLSTTATWASQTGASPRARGRRLASRVSSSGTHSVSTLRLENAVGSVRWTSRRRLSEPLLPIAHAWGQIWNT